MSINVLKKKSQRFQQHISGKGHDGFSLVGGYRNIGIVGQTNLAKSVSRTRFRGNLPMGHGGQNGQFKIVINNSGSCCGNDPSIIKPTVKNTKDAILQQNKWLHSAYPRYWVKNGATEVENFSQGEYIKNIVVKAATCVVSKTDSGIDNCGSPSESIQENKRCGAASYYIGGKKYIRMPYAKTLNTLAVSSSEYMRSGLLKNNNLPTPACLAPFPFVQNNRGCVPYYLTPQQAINNGLLPSDWMNCDPANNPLCNN